MVCRRTEGEMAGERGEKKRGKERRREEKVEREEEMK